ncbi:MAG: cytochrome-c oxidase, cbb3-type subunit III [Nevskiaceae bacterium]|jgi:cytochrome c oxidase cbb3-type subunit 3|nr:cytochrome-c oxidase, cbb3-type subunit III [Nevskiaceae bacterium]
MSPFWSFYIILLVVINLGGCTFLLWWTSRPKLDDPGNTSHVWDGDITEYDKPLPRWWINLFYLTLVFSVGYLIWYPGAGSFAGIGKWTSQNEVAKDQAAGDEKLAATFRPFEGKSIDELARDATARALGRGIYGSQCATCHGALAQGANGYPNLTDNIWHWGGSAEQVTQTVLQGRTAAMPSWSEALTSMGGANAVDDVTTYVLSRTDSSLLSTNAEAIARGGKLFASVCSACHGADGRGNVDLGSPDLTDSDWLYGRSRAAIREGIERGRNGVMPAQQPLIGEMRARLAAAYVWSLSHPTASQ